MSMHAVIATAILAAFAVASAVWFAYTRNGRHAIRVLLFAAHRLLVPATGQHGLDQPAGVRKMLRELALAVAWHMPRYWTWRAGLTALYHPRFGLRANRDQAARWRLYGLLARSRRVCPANLHGALIWRTRPLREILVDDECRQDCALNGRCWCGNLRDENKLRAQAAASAPGGGTAPAPPPHGAVPLTDATGGVTPYPAPTVPQPALTEPLPAARNYAPPANWTPYAPQVIP